MALRWLRRGHTMDQPRPQIGIGFVPDPRVLIRVNGQVAVPRLRSVRTGARGLARPPLSGLCSGGSRPNGRLPGYYRHPVAPCGKLCRRWTFHRLQQRQKATQRLWGLPYLVQVASRQIPAQPWSYLRQLQCWELSTARRAGPKVDAETLTRPLVVELWAVQKALRREEPSLRAMPCRCLGLSATAECLQPDQPSSDRPGTWLHLHLRTRTGRRKPRSGRRGDARIQLS